MKNFLISVLCICVLACNTSGPEEENPKDINSDQIPDESFHDGLMWEKNGIKVYEANVDLTFPDAKISLLDPIAPQAGPNQFNFQVENYTLGDQTGDAQSRSCANSAKGQHIHFIMNNSPYKAKYESSFEEDVPEGTNVLLAFLSRSYHESIKTQDAHVLIKYGQGGQDLSEPLLFYSRPKGTYAGDDGQKLLLDFFLRNVSLSETGYKVRATINGTEFMLPKWSPYFVEGLPAGENTFRLELIDSEGNPVQNALSETGEKTVGIYSDSGERIVNITEG